MEQLKETQQAIAGLRGMHALFEYVNDMATHGCVDAINIRCEIYKTICRKGAQVEHPACIREMAHGVVDAPETCTIVANDMVRYFGTFGLDETLCRAFAWYVFERCNKNDMHAHRLVHKLGQLFN